MIKRTIILMCCMAGILPAMAQAPGIPADKGLTPAYVHTLYERGEPTVYLRSRGELDYIGMPVGGITCGGVYLGGDGRLWLWDIFNEHKEGIEPTLAEWNGQLVRPRDGAAYIEPARDIRPLRQGFLLRFEYGGQTVYKTLEASHWDEIAFEATYPVGTVRYTDRKLPAELVLRAYSPFIPLDEEDSALPATILSFTVRNTGSEPMRVSLVGYLENKAGLRTVNHTVCRRVNEVRRTDKFTAVSQGLQVLRERYKETQQALPDYGTLCIAALDAGASASPDIDLSDATTCFDRDSKSDICSKSLREPLIGAIQTDLQIAAGAEAEADFVIGWYFPNLKMDERIKDGGRYYATRFDSAFEVAGYVADNFERLSSTTRMWLATWQESTLPHWFLERTLLTVNTLATDNCYRLGSGRFWAWEGVGVCPGTCTHVWQYAQAMGRLFPALERDCRERTDLRIAMQPDGGIVFRAEMESRPAIDGQAGTVLRCLREHQMSADNAFLMRNWPEIRRAVQFIIDQDRNADGMEDTPMENTLDAVWDGEIAWIVGLCIAGVKAGGEMALEAGDPKFAALCDEYVRKGSENMDRHLFNGEYYIHRPDPEKGRAKLGSYNTCHIDQVMGQSWAWQAGLGRIQDEAKTRSALDALWRYNFTPDVGSYIALNRGGRPYALAGEGGMIMNTNPHGEAKPYGDNVTWQLGYFHECMSGFEYQVAAHMIAEGMTDRGLAMVRAIHNRYHASKRNPFNEIECSDHYARAMASYGAFVAACGFEYHGPKGSMRFAPKWSAADFRAPFTAAEGWGTYAQRQQDDRMNCTLTPRYGEVQLQTFGVEAPEGISYRSVHVRLDGKRVTATVAQKDREVTVTFGRRITIPAGTALEIQLQKK